MKDASELGRTLLDKRMELERRPPRPACRFEITDCDFKR
jgi:hypothetical protein